MFFTHDYVLFLLTDSLCTFIKISFQCNDYIAGANARGFFALGSLVAIDKAIYNQPSNQQ